MPSPAGLNVTIDEGPSWITVTPVGELDLANSGALRSTLWGLADDGHESLVLDLGELEFIDTSGLHLVLELVKHCEDVGVGLSVRPGRFAIQRAFEISGLRAWVPFQDAATPGVG
jgi:anti-sigma B factor antagonist